MVKSGAPFRYRFFIFGNNGIYFSLNLDNPIDIIQNSVHVRV
jgi:hypothetical protein